MSKNQVAKKIAEGLLCAGATVYPVNEEPHLVIREIAPYPALFRAEIRRRFGVQLQQTDLNMTINVASRIDPTRHQFQSASLSNSPFQRVSIT